MRKDALNQPEKRHMKFAMKSTCAALGLFVTALAFGQTTAYPNKPIRIIVPYAPGGGVDTVIRQLSTPMSEILGKTILVENKPGGATMNATDYVAKSPADGYTLLATGAPIYLNTALGMKTPYNPVKDLAPISLLVNNPVIIVVNPDIPVKTMNELVDYSKKQPNGLNYGTAGVGSIAHLSGELLKAKTGVKMNHIPYKGSAPALVDLMGGQISVLVDAIIPTAVQVKAGKGIGLAIASTARSPVLPNVPTLAEAGYPGLNFGGTFGMMAPAKTPPEVIAKVHAAMLKAISTPQMRKQLGDMGYEIIANTPDEYGAYIRNEIKTWTKIVKDNDIKTE
jgi:tripartite-type tricarboxylate transporter receptor subunit TctC